MQQRVFMELIHGFKQVFRQSLKKKNTKRNSYVSVCVQAPTPCAPQVLDNPSQQYPSELSGSAPLCAGWLRGHLTSGDTVMVGALYCLFKSTPLILQRYEPRITCDQGGG